MARPAPAPAWRACQHATCPPAHFLTPQDFESHVREKHSIKEGSIVLCQYGKDGLCSSLQFGDLSEAGFRYHVRQNHINIDAETNDWTFFSSTQNLPAVLNDPNRGKQSNFFTKTWGDSFVEKYDITQSPHLPNITLSHFESYCKKISKRLRRHTRLKDNSTLRPHSVSISEDVCEVPSIFYQQSLPLNDAEIFKKVFPNLCDSDNATTAARALQESLSTYLDVIEMKISKQVALKSNAFFHAMLSHDTIMEQMSSAVKLVKETRVNLKHTTANLTEKPLKLVKLTRTRDKLNSVFEQLKLMSTVQQTQPMIQLLLSTSDYVAALDLISSTQKVLLSHLTGVHAFRHLSPQLTEMERLINKMLNNEFHRFAVSDLNRPPSDASELQEKDKLISIISGILRLREFDFIDTFKAEAITTVQATVKQIVIEIISDRDGNAEIALRGGSGADNTWLGSNEGIIFLQKASPYLLNLLKRVSVINNLILEVSQMEDLSTVQNEDFWTEEEQIKIKLKLKKMLCSLSDYCNERCANLLSPKSEKDNVLIDFTQLATMSKLIDDFSTECDSITGHSNNTLKLALRSFSMKFIQNLHNERRTKLTICINAERWKPADVPPELQSMVDDICKNDEIPLKIVYAPSNRPDSKFLTIKNESYAIVGTVQLLIRIVLEYCDVARQSPVILQYVMHCLLELIRLFNSRCCQLVLGAGALQSAGLKTITTSNLALVSRSLQVVLWFLPIVRQLLVKIETGETHLNGFDSLENDIMSHKDEIENKIYNIVSNLLASQLTGWDARPPVPSQTFRNISKHLVKLHEALSNILPLDQIRCIYKQVHDNFKDKLRDQLARMNIVANGGPQHGVVTSELTFYLQTLKTLQVVTDNDIEDNILYDIWIR